MASKLDEDVDRLMEWELAERQRTLAGEYSEQEVIRSVMKGAACLMQQKGLDAEITGLHDSVSPVIRMVLPNNSVYEFYCRKSRRTVG